MKEIDLTRGQVALVDDEDFEYLNQFKWCVQKGKNTLYAVRNNYNNGKSATQYMHGAILNGKGIDHIDHNGLNNQRSNLRLCSQSENSMNTQKYANKSSSFKGVSFHKLSGKWRAYIMINGKETHLGYFTSEIEAAKAYNTKAIALFCEFANLNKID